MNAAEARKLVGKRVTWKTVHGRGILKTHEGTLQEVFGRNYKIDGDWRWRHHLIDFQEKK